MAGVERLLHLRACHDLSGLAKGDLSLIKNKRVGEDLGDTLKLMVRGDDEVAAVA